MDIMQSKKYMKTYLINSDYNFELWIIMNQIQMIGYMNIIILM